MAYKVILVEDDFAIRQGIKSLLKEIGKDNDVEIYSSANGLEGLGFIFIVNPDLLIIDTTLPKYSGRETLEYLHTNSRFDDSKILVLTEEAEYSKELPSGYTIVNKNGDDFVKKLKSFIHVNLGNNEPISLGFKGVLINAVNKYGNKSDCLLHNFSKNSNFLKPLLLLKWIYFQTLLSIYLSLLYLTGGKVEDNNVKQDIGDSNFFRVRTYPTLATLFITGLFLLLQVGLFVTGGALVLSRYRIESISAIFDSAVEINLNYSTYDVEKIESSNGVIQLKSIETVIEDSSEVLTNPQEPEETPTEIGEEEIPETNEPLVEEPTQEETPVQEEIPTSLTEGVLGASEEGEVVITYSTDKPAIILNQEVRYTELLSIKESSSVNTFESSITDLDQTIEQLASRSFEANEITYQLSPNKVDWYYYGGEDTWEITNQGFASSNTIQEINKYLDKYTPQVASEEKAVYIKVFLHSDGNSQVTLNGVTVNRDLNIVTELQPEADQPLAEEEEPSSLMEPISYPISLVEEIVEETNISEEIVKAVKNSNVIILNASFANGNKVMSGYVENNNEWISENLNKLKIRIYYTGSTAYANKATNKGELIGESELIKINKNNEDQFVWEMRAPSSSGGYVTAELIYTEDDKSIQSELSNPIQNSTFTVNETGDQVDFSAGDGVCDHDNVTPGSQCTWRAAIQEANALAGADNIFFNIPISDTGYRDYDDPNTLSSGDSVGGDDYWTIRPATSITAPSESVIIDGSTQRTNQGDLNTFGPEIEIKSQMTINSTNVTFNELVINGQVSGEYGIISAGDMSGFVLTNSYLGVDVKSLADATTGTQGIRYTAALSTNITIGSNTSDGNIIAGFGSAIDWTCNSSGTQTVTIRGNKIGLGQTGNLVGNTSSGINFSGGCVMEIGGPSSTHRNYIGGSPRGINPQASSVAQIKIRNNFFGTDLTGTQNRANTSGIRMDNAGVLYSLPDNKIIIGGAPGEGNLFRFNPAEGLRVEANKAFEISYNTFADNGRAITLGSDSAPTYEQVRVEVYNNYIGSSANDPYFGLNVGGNVSYGIFNRSASPIIKGNYINGNGRYGIFNITTASQSRTSYQAHYVSRPQIGGTAAFSGSLCSGLERNCIVGNLWSGISSFETVPINEDTLYTDNDFSSGNGTGNSRNIEQVWYGLFEIFSGTNRRTDLSGGVISFPAGTQVRTTDDPSTIVTNGTTLNATCLNGAGVGCPAAGHTTGTINNTQVIAPVGALLTNETTWYRIVEYVVDNGGIKTNYDPFKFESSHQASTNFTYEGESTDNVLSTGSLRVLNSQNYTDRGEPWTNLPTATRDIATNGLGRFQIMEVEYVDANPIFDGTDWIITVDSTTDEDNVSTCGFDDGSGSYSGGGCGGLGGLPNGKTSFREAILVANNFSLATRIEFNIPTSDPGWNTVDFPNAFKILHAGAALELTRPGIIIDGSSQTAFTGDTSTVISEPDTMPVVGNATRGPEIIFDYSSNTSVSPFRLNAADITVDSIGFYNNPTDMRRGLSIFPAATNSIIRNCDFVNNEGGISASPGNVGLHLHDSVIRNNAENDYRFDGIESDLSGAVIENNQFISNGGAGIGIQQPVASNEGAIIRNNLIKSNGFSPTVQSPGIIVAAAPPGPPAIEIYNIEIYNNKIISNSKHGVMIAKGANFINVHNNVLYGSSLNPLELSDLQIDFDVISGDGNNINDTGDTDDGANDLMNYPTIEAVEYLGGGMYRISGDIDGNTSEDPFEIEVCESDNHVSGHGGCIESLGTVEANSPWSIIVEFSGEESEEEHIFSALATNTNGSTSEFSENFVANEANPDYSIATYPVELTSPLNNLLISDRTPRFDWNANGDPDTLVYEIYFGTDPDNLTLLTEVPSTQTNYTIPDNLNYGTYYWQVIAKNVNDVERGRSEVETFRIGAITGEFSLIYPIDEMEIDERKPVLMWSPSGMEEVTYYQIYFKEKEEGEISTSELEYSYLTKVNGRENTEYTFTSELNYGRYSWKVIAYYADGVVAQDSGIEYFTIFEPRVIVPDIEVDDGLSDSPDNVPEEVTNIDDTGLEAIQIVSIALLVIGIGAAVITTGVLSAISGTNVFVMFGVLFGRIYRKDSTSKALNIFGKILLIIMCLGFMVTLYAAIKDFNAVNIILLIIYAVLFAINLYYFVKRRNTQVPTDY